MSRDSQKGTHNAVVLLQSVMKVRVKAVRAGDKLLPICEVRHVSESAQARSKLFVFL